jgi:Putative prokaryotic signal transducing protein
MKKLYTPSDESELVFLKSMFEASGMPYYVHNEHFGSMYSGAYMSSLNAKTIMVPEDIYDDARELILSVMPDAVFEDERNEGGGGRGDGLLESLLDLLSLGGLFPSKRKKRDGRND